MAGARTAVGRPVAARAAVSTGVGATICAAVMAGACPTVSGAVLVASLVAHLSPPGS